MQQDTVGPYELAEVYLEDRREGMQQLSSDSVDVAIAGPPYNLSKGGDWKWGNSIYLLVLLLCSTIFAHAQSTPQDPTSQFATTEKTEAVNYALFRAEPLASADAQQNLYKIRAGLNNGIQKVTLPVAALAIYDKRRDLPDLLIGEAVVLKTEADETVVRLRYNSGFDPEAGEALLVELPIVALNPHYSSVSLDLAVQAISFVSTSDLLIFDMATMRQDNMQVESDLLAELRTDVVWTAGDLRGRLDPMTIENGPFSGMDLFDAMEKIRQVDVLHFLEFIRENPVKYRGMRWKFSEIMATWLVNGAPLASTSSVDSFTAFCGMQWQIDHTFEYPRVTSVSRAFFSDTGDDLLHGLILSINGNSLFRKKPEELSQLLSAEEFTESSFRFLSAESVHRVLTLVHRAQPADPAWKAAEGDAPVVDLFVIRQGDFWGIIDKTGFELVEPRLDDIQAQYFPPFQQGLEGAKLFNHWGFINLEGDWAVQPDYVQIREFDHDLAAVKKPEEGGWEFLSSHWAFIDRIGQQVIGPSEISSLASFSEDLCAVIQNEKTGYMNKSGEVVIPYQFEFARNFSGGLAAITLVKNGKFGYIDAHGRTIIAPQYYTAGSFVEGSAIVGIEKDVGPWHLIDSQGKVLADFPAQPTSNGLSPTQIHNQRIRIFRNGLYGFADGSGNIVIPIVYSDCHHTFSNGLVGVTRIGKKTEGSFQKQGGWYFIDESGRTVIDGDYQEVSRFAEELCWVKANGKWGLIDLAGEWRLSPLFSDMPGPYRNGLSRLNMDIDYGGVMPERFYAYLDTQGQVVWMPK